MQLPLSVEDPCAGTFRQTRCEYSSHTTLPPLGKAAVRTVRQCRSRPARLAYRRHTKLVPTHDFRIAGDRRPELRNQKGKPVLRISIVIFPTGSYPVRDTRSCKDLRPEWVFLATSKNKAGRKGHSAGFAFQSQLLAGSIIRRCLPGSVSARKAL